MSYINRPLLVELFSMSPLPSGVELRVRPTATAATLSGFHLLTEAYQPPTSYLLAYSSLHSYPKQTKGKRIEKMRTLTPDNTHRLCEEKTKPISIKPLCAMSNKPHLQGIWNVSTSDRLNYTVDLHFIWLSEICLPIQSRLSLQNIQGLQNSGQPMLDPCPLRWASWSDGWTDWWISIGRLPTSDGLVRARLI